MQAGQVADGQASQLFTKSHLTVVQLTGLGNLALPPDGGVDTPKMRQGGCERQPVQHLKHIHSCPIPLCTDLQSLPCILLTGSSAWQSTAAAEPAQNETALPGLLLQ